VSFTEGLDLVFGSEFGSFNRVAAKCDEDALFDLRMGERSQEFPDGFFAHLPRPPMLALNGGGLAVLGDHEVDAPVRVGAAAPGDGIAKLAIGEGDDLLELEPVNGADLVQEQCGAAWLTRGCNGFCRGSKAVRLERAE